MNTAINQLVKSVVHKNSLSECSVNELEKLVAQYPYFGPAQFLLAQKLKQENSPVYEKQSQRAILYFQDHLWFDYMIRGEDATGVFTEGNPTETYTAQEPVTETILPAETTNGYEANNVIPELPADPLPTIESITTNAEETQVNSWPDEKETETSDYHDPAPVEEINTAIAEEPVTELVVEQKENHPVEYAEPLPVVEIPIEAIQEPAQHDEREIEVPEEQQAETVKEEKAPALPQFKIAPVSAQAVPLSFEPYHTVDYFASQGIRFKEEEKPKDRFGQQLKSFTEWLKAMKKLPETETTAAPVVSEDRKVTQLAEHSLADREVVTEAMADVWEQQGNSQKAIDTYRKLSLLNPDKSAYFAAKIDHLKNL